MHPFENKSQNGQIVGYNSVKKKCDSGGRAGLNRSWVAFRLLLYEPCCFVCPDLWLHLATFSLCSENDLVFCSYKYNAHRENVKCLQIFVGDKDVFFSAVNSTFELIFCDLHLSRML